MLANVEALAQEPGDGSFKACYTNDDYTSGRKRFSIIIMDNDFNIIGETLFPDYSYHSKSMFVEEEGLYIRSNHFKSPDFDEDKLMFTCFKLLKD